jgi:threonine dehydrogenase-like Zn-dependent dehydrogenase
MSSMKAVVIDRPGSCRLTEVEKPAAAPGWAVIRVHACAVCATDLELIAGTIGRQYPIIPGHEWSGVVESVGSPEDAVWVGKRVVGSNDIVCLTCSECRSGMWRNCRSFREIGFKADGAYAEYRAVPVYALYELPGSVSFTQGALVEPLGVALGTAEKAGIRLGDTVAILGAGSIGLNLLAVAMASGARRVAVSALTERRLDFARRMGAYATVATQGRDIARAVVESLGGPADIVLEATGIDDCIVAAFKIARKGGSVALAGYGRDKDIPVHIDDIHINNLRVYGAGNNWNLVEKSIRLLEDGILSTSALATHFLKLDEYEKGLEMTRERPAGFVKAVFTF